MRLNLNIFKKSIVCVCLCIYVLFGFLSANVISICYGAEDDKHVGINLFGNESCCIKEETTSENKINTPKNSKFFNQSKCNCIDQKIVDNQCQQISTNYILSKLIAINKQEHSVIVSFEEKYNKINWDIYSHKNISNQLNLLKTLILVI